MKKTVLFAAVLFCALLGRAANLLPADTPDSPFGAWSKVITEKKIPAQLLKHAGPGGIDALKLDLSAKFSPQIKDIKLEAGKKYRFGAFVKTAGFKHRLAKIVLYNQYWRKDIRTGDIPSDTEGKWHLVEGSDILPPSANGRYSLILYCTQVPAGADFQIALPFIEEEKEEKAAAPGQNLLDRPVSSGRPFGIWTQCLTQSKMQAKLVKQGGPELSDAWQPDFTSHYQMYIPGLKFTAGQKYKFGVFVKTRNFRNKRSMLVIYNQWWNKQLTTGSIPRDTHGQWIQLGGSGVMPPSANGKYTFSIYTAKAQKGSEIMIANPYVIPVAEKQAAVRPPAKGGNILPDFRPTLDGEFGLWTRSLLRGGDSVKKLPGAGPDGQDAISTDSARCQISMSSLNLIAGETYRFGAYVRTAGINGADSRIVIYNNGWFNDINSNPIPDNTHGKWVKIEKTAVAPKSSNGTYVYRFYMPNHGRVDICAPFLEAVTEKGKAGTYPPESTLSSLRRLYPVMPLMKRIPARDPKMIFGFSCPVPGSLQDYEFAARFLLKDLETPWKTYPVENQFRIHADWGEALPEGAGWLDVQLRRKSDGKVEIQNKYEVVLLPPVPPVKVKQLNNLVGELMRIPLKDGRVDFVNPRLGWIYFGCRNNSRVPVITLDGKQKILYPADDGRGSETMRNMTAGKHFIEISGVAGDGGELIVRTVPEIVLFPLTFHAKRDDSKFYYDRAFYRKHFWNNINTYYLYFGWNPKTELERSIGKELRDRGMRFIGSNGFGAKGWSDRDRMYNDFLSNWTTISTEGRACDETSASADANILINYSENCWRLTSFDKFIHVWLGPVTDMLNYPPLHTPFIAGATNIGNGNGKLSMETYVENTPDLPSLKKYYQLVGNHLKCASACVPDAPERMIMFFSGYLTNGVWNCNSYPDSDIKYALDYYMHLVSTLPEGKGLYGVGCYDLNYADEENARWIGRLFRHYAVEGNTEMLSPRYGFEYAAGHVKNGDFKEGLKDWEVLPAEKGSIKPNNYGKYGYGFVIQRRRGIGHGNGNTVAELIRSPKGPNRLRQTFKNFKPGKLYSLSYVTADGEAIEKKIFGRRESYLEASMDGVEIIPELGYECRIPFTNRPRLEVVTRKIVFRAQKPEIKVEFSDWKNNKEPGGPMGARRILNFVSVKSYYSEQ